MQVFILWIVHTSYICRVWKVDTRTFVMTEKYVLVGHSTLPPTHKHPSRSKLRCILKITFYIILNLANSVNLLFDKIFSFKNSVSTFFLDWIGTIPLKKIFNWSILMRFLNSIFRREERGQNKDLGLIQLSLAISKFQDRLFKSFHFYWGFWYKR